MADIFGELTHPSWPTSRCHPAEDGPSSSSSLRLRSRPKPPGHQSPTLCGGQAGRLIAEGRVHETENYLWVGPKNDGEMLYWVKGSDPQLRTLGPLSSVATS